MESHSYSELRAGMSVTSTGLYHKPEQGSLCCTPCANEDGHHTVIPGHAPKPLLSAACLAELTSGGPRELVGGPGAVLCCCFSSSICCREKKGRRREGGSSGWRRPHSSKLLACRHRTCRRRFFLCRVLKWQYSQAKGLAPVGTHGGMLAPVHPAVRPLPSPGSLP